MGVLCQVMGRFVNKERHIQGVLRYEGAYLRHFTYKKQHVDSAC